MSSQLSPAFQTSLNTLFAAGLVELRTEGEERRQYGIHPGAAQLLAMANQTPPEDGSAAGEDPS